MVVLLLYSSSCMLLTRHSSISISEFSVTPGQFSVTFFPASTTISPTMESANRDVGRRYIRHVAAVIATGIKEREKKRRKKEASPIRGQWRDLHDRAASGPFRRKSDKMSSRFTLFTHWPTLTTPRPVVRRRSKIPTSRKLDSCDHEKRNKFCDKSRCVVISIIEQLIILTFSLRARILTYYTLKIHIKNIYSHRDELLLFFSIRRWNICTMRNYCDKRSPSQSIAIQRTPTIGITID